ncbi:MAG: U32 family peptidase [Patescibacteria group bacterium]
MKNGKLELIAPAGNLEKMKTAFAFGADAVYLGIPDFSLRARINDFDIKSILQAAAYAQKMDRKIYVTLNIFAYEAHFKKLPSYVRELKKINVDALIISDPGILAVVKKIWPGAVIHLSTQANCINSEAAKFWFGQGVSRVILGREASLEDIKKIKRAVPKLKLECFVHGAMCMAYSGRCFLSKYLSGRSANLGDCAQPCRWPYAVEDIGDGSMQKTITPNASDKSFDLIEENGYSYILNSKDLCLINYLDDLVKAGVSSFKIEGRTKSAYYIAAVVGAYKKALENLPDKKLAASLHRELEEKIYNRGFTTGFIFDEGKLAQNLKTSKEDCCWEFCGQVEKWIKSGHKYDVYVKVHNTLRTGEEIEIVGPIYDIMKIRIEKMREAESGKLIDEAHGGSDKVIVIKCENSIPQYSVIRRKI